MSHHACDASDSGGRMTVRSSKQPRMKSSSEDRRMFIDVGQSCSKMDQSLCLVSHCLMDTLRWSRRSAHDACSIYSPTRPLSHSYPCILTSVHRESLVGQSHQVFKRSQKIEPFACARVFQSRLDRRREEREDGREGRGGGA